MPDVAQPIETYPGKEAFARLINEACERLDLVKKGHWDYRVLARRAGLHPATVMNGVGQRYAPAVTTLQKLAEVTDIPLQTWLASLGQLPPEEMQHTGLAPAVERRLQHMIATYGERYVIRALDWLERAPEREGPAASEDTPRG